MNELQRIKQLAGLLTEEDNHFVIYVNGKPAMKYTSESHAMADFETLKSKFPDKSISLGKEECEIRLIKEAHDLVMGALSEEDEADMEMQAQSNVNSDAAETDEDPVQENMSNISVHEFESTEDAYDATQTGSTISYDDEMGSETEVKDGDILIIPDEGVVGICTTYPIAVTKKSGKLHKLKDEYSTPETIAKAIKVPLENVQAAFDKAQELGFDTVGNVEEGYTVMPGIDKERYTDLSAEGLEGPFRLKSGKVVYYDPKMGQYYDRDTDMYISQDDVDQHSLEEAYDLNNGYKDRHYAKKEDYFPDGADSPVVDSVGPSGAKQGDNPEQKKMQVSETYTEIVYAYRKFLKESSQDQQPITESKKKLNENHSTVSDFSIVDDNLTVDVHDDGTVSCVGSIDASATLTYKNGKSIDIGWRIEIGATSDIEYGTDDDQFGRQITTIDSIKDPVFSELKFDFSEPLIVDNKEVQISSEKQSAASYSLNALLSPNLYKDFILDKVSNKLDNLE
jgi:hypothetical protein